MYFAYDKWLKSKVVLRHSKFQYHNIFNAWDFVWSTSSIEFNRLQWLDARFFFELQCIETYVLTATNLLHWIRINDRSNANTFQQLLEEVALRLLRQATLQCSHRSTDSRFCRFQPYWCYKFLIVQAEHVKKVASQWSLLRDRCDPLVNNPSREKLTAASLNSRKHSSKTTLHTPFENHWLCRLRMWRRWLPDNLAVAQSGTLTINQSGVACERF